MKIIFLQDDFPPLSFGGAGISVYELAQGMQKAGHEVCVITTCTQVSDAGESNYNGLQLIKIHSQYHERWRAYKSLWNVSVTKKVEKILKEQRPDVVHINNIHRHLSFYCFVIARRYAKKVVFTARDTMSICYGKLATKRYLDAGDVRMFLQDRIAQAGWRYNPLYVYCVRRFLRYAHARVTVSNALRLALIENGITDVVCIHTGIAVSAWGARPEEIDQFILAHGLQNKKVVLHNGRLSQGKGSDALFEAMKQVVATIPDAVLVVVGPESDYAEKIGGGLPSGAVVFTGWIDRDMVRISFAAADIVVVPSVYLDPFPRVVLEAMASRKPVVGSCYGGSPEVIQDGVTGYIVNPQHPTEIAEKCIALLNNTTQSEEFGFRGFERIQKDFSMESVVKQYESLYSAPVKN